MIYAQNKKITKNPVTVHKISYSRILDYKTLRYCILMDYLKDKKSFISFWNWFVTFSVAKKSIIIFQTKRNKRIAYTVWLYLVIYIMLIVPKKDSFNEEKCHRMFSFERWDFSFVLRNNFLETLSLLRKIKYMQFVLFDRSRDLRYKKCHMGIHVQYKECLHRSLYMVLLLVFISLSLSLSQSLS